MRSAAMLGISTDLHGAPSEMPALMSELWLRAVGSHLVAHAANGLNELGVRAQVDLLAQVIDVNVDHIGHGVERQVPHVLDNHGAGHILAGMPQEVFEQREFLGRQVDRKSTRLNSSHGS